MFKQSIFPCVSWLLVETMNHLYTVALRQILNFIRNKMVIPIKMRETFLTLLVCYVSTLYGK
jgi:hypothetical protein